MKTKYTNEELKNMKNIVISNIDKMKSSRVKGYDTSNEYYDLIETLIAINSASKTRHEKYYEIVIDNFAKKLRRIRR